MQTLPIFFAAEMVADSGSYSPSAEKPAQVVRRFLQTGLPVRLERPEPLSVDTLSLAHERQFVTDVLEGRRGNGFGNRSAEVAASLCWTNGAMLSAASAALKSGTVACAPCSGFHHAHWDRAGGFCTFNGLMITAQALRQAGKVHRVGILDFDMHYGDGTDSILSKLGIDWVTHITAGRFYDQPDQAHEFLDRIPEWMSTLSDCDLILYQAGADPHVDDPLGGFLTTEQLFQRDRLVFQHAHRQRTPIVWNLAGGYQKTPSGGIEPVLDIHENTLRACIEAFGVGQ